MHFKEAKTILTPQNGMNLYRGCTNDCIFCDARSKCYRIDHDFTDVCIKKDGDMLLENMLKKKRNRGMISTGNLSDPYMDIENEQRAMRKCLKVIERYDFGVVIQTKCELILRDIEIIRNINKKTKAVVVIPLCTADDELCKKLEPKASVYSKRLSIMDELMKNDIPCIVNLESVIPGICDSYENVSRILEDAAKRKVYGIEHRNFTMNLRVGCREYFLDRLKENIPAKYESFCEEYSTEGEIVSKNKDELVSLVNSYCDGNNMIRVQEEIVRFKRVYDNKTQGVQMSIFDF